MLESAGRNGGQSCPDSAASTGPAGVSGQTWVDAVGVMLY